MSETSCVDCGAPLPPGWRYPECNECYGRRCRALADAIREASARGASLREIDRIYAEGMRALGAERWEIRTIGGER